jgi:hypothetical protein
MTKLVSSCCALTFELNSRIKAKKTTLVETNWKKSERIVFTTQILVKENNDNLRVEYELNNEK